MADALPIFRISSLQPDGGCSTQSVSAPADGIHSAEVEANHRFESMRDSGKNLAVYLFSRGHDGRADLIEPIRAWARPAATEEPGEWSKAMSHG